MNIQAFLIWILLGLACVSCRTEPNHTQEKAATPVVAPAPSVIPVNEDSPATDAPAVSLVTREPGSAEEANGSKTKPIAPKTAKPTSQKTDNQSPPAKASSSSSEPGIPKTPPVEVATPEPAKEAEPTPSSPTPPVVVSTPAPVAFSHEIWDGLLIKHVSASGKVNYKGFIQDKTKHQAYLDLLSKNPPQPDWKRNEKLAFWINAYNAFTVKLIVDNYPIKSITDINGGKPWDKSFIQIGVKTYTLNHIENKIVRPQFKEPRIHFAVNCAAKSCPPLLNAAFKPETLNSQLEKTTRAFIRNSSSNEVTEKKLVLSKIFEWYQEDFTSSGSLIDYINKYAAVQANENAKVSFMEYDWGLNE